MRPWAQQKLTYAWGLYISFNCRFENSNCSVVSKTIGKFFTRGQDEGNSSPPFPPGYATNYHTRGRHMSWNCMHWYKLNCTNVCKTYCTWLKPKQLSSTRFECYGLLTFKTTEFYHWTGPPKFKFYQRTPDLSCLLSRHSSHVNCSLLKNPEKSFLWFDLGLQKNFVQHIENIAYLNIYRR